MKDAKCIAPCQKLVFLGVLIDVLDNSVQLEESRCKKYLIQFRELKLEAKSAGRIGRRELASLVGKLNFAAPFYRNGSGKIFGQWNGLGAISSKRQWGMR